MCVARCLLAAAFAAFTAASLSAGSICPGGTGSTPFTHSPDAAATGCNTVITIGVSGSSTITIPDSSPYDGSEDNLVGVVNNSSLVINSLTLGGGNIFGFDADGICTFTFTGSSYCSSSQKGGTDPQDYQGPTSTFTVTNSGSGTVNFSPGVAAHGGTAYFSLEEAPSTSLTVTGVGGSPGPGSSVPEPSTILLVAGGLGLAALRRKRVA